MRLGSDYYQWLLNSIGVLHGNHLDYLLLMRHLNEVPYEYMLYSDKNRAIAGTILRTHFAHESGVYLEDVFSGDCTVLEMLVALATRIMYDYGTDRSKEEWFWELMSNLGLDKFNDAEYNETEVDTILDIWMHRKYEPNGYGSLFPIDGYFEGDATTMSVWDQMNLYMTRKYPVGNWLG